MRSEGFFFEDIFYVLISELGLERAYGYVWERRCVSSLQKTLETITIDYFPATFRCVCFHSAREDSLNQLINE